MSKKITTKKSRAETILHKPVRTVIRKNSNTSATGNSNNEVTTDKEFSFNEVNLGKANEIIKKYPEGMQKSAILPLLDLAQRQHGGWLSTAVIEYVANLIAQPYIRVYEVATFYTMFNLKPIGKYHLQVCGTTPCWLRGSREIMQVCQQKTNTKCGTTSSDGLFTISEVECLGACINAPVIQVNDNFAEHLTVKKVVTLIDKLKKMK